MSACSSRRFDWHYQLGRWGLVSGAPPIRSPWRRHAVPLPISMPHMRSALASIAQCVALAGMPLRSRLVELSAMISFEGARAQPAHSDLPPAELSGELGAPPLLTAWLALQDVDSSMGPTHVFPRSHIRYRRRSEIAAREAAASEAAEGREKAADAEGGWFLPRLDDDDELERENRRAAEAQSHAPRLAEDERRELAGFGAAPGPIELLLPAGTVALMDSRLYHYGGGHFPRVSAHAMGSTATARVLLNTTFALDALPLDGAAGGAPAKHQEHMGFTYHSAGDLDGATLASLLDFEDT
jgi:hypothetical protein